MTQGETLTAAIDRMAARVRSEAICDFILHAGAWPPSPDTIAAMKGIAEAGQPSFKIFMTRADFGARLPLVIQQLEAARDAGVVTMMHCEDGALLAAAVRRLEAEGRPSLRDYGESRPIIAEVAATQQAAAYQQALVEEIVVREGFGADRVPDLLFVNYKAIDTIGHLFSADGVEMSDAVRTQDGALASFVEFLDQTVGQGR